MGTSRCQEEREHTDMPATLQITKKLAVTPLIDIHNAAFANNYAKGLWWSLNGEYEGVKPLPDSYLVDNLKRDASKGMFDDQHNDSLYHLGFYFGMVHGGILAPRTGGQLRPDVTTLVIFTHCDTARGYHVARRDLFYYASSESRTLTDSALIEALYQSEQDLLCYPYEPDSWYYSIGCILGSLRVSLFASTAQEWHAWKTEHRAWQAKLHRDTAQGRDADPLDPVAVVAYPV
jgi:hypothetical protein